MEINFPWLKTAIGHNYTGQYQLGIFPFLQIFHGAYIYVRAGV
jgi:hypothetical protein